VRNLLKKIITILIIILLVSIICTLFNYIICLPVIFLIGLTIILIIYSTSKKYLIDIFQNEEVSNFRQKTINILCEQSYKIKEKKEKIYVESGSLTATSLYFKQKDNNIEFYRTNTATPTAWILFVIGIFTALIVSIIIGILSETNSKNFAEKTILPLLKNKRCSNCGRSNPYDGRICSYCGKNLL